MVDTWDPEVYERFKRERALPFHDLLALVRGSGPDDAAPPVRRVVDLGCGTGELTRLLHDRFGAGTTVGIDSSPAMLADAEAHAAGTSGLAFEPGDIGDPALLEPASKDLVFANASLQWVPGHREVLGAWTAALAPGGQLAVQVPANADGASHTLIEEIAAEAPFAESGGLDLAPDPVRLNVLEPVEYSQILFDLGFEEQHVRLQIYAHVLDSAATIADWTAGTSLTRARKVFAPDVYDAFVARYKARLVEVLGSSSPHLFPFRRILLWGRLPG